MIDKFDLYISDEDVTQMATPNPTVFRDQTIACAGCGQPFLWTAEQQEFYQEKQLSAPKRCKPCRDARRNERERGRH